MLQSGTMRDAPLHPLSHPRTILIGELHLTLMAPNISAAVLSHRLQRLIVPSSHVSSSHRLIVSSLGIALDLVLYLKKTQFNTRNKTRGFNLGFIPQVSNQVYNPGIIGYYTCRQV